MNTQTLLYRIIAVDGGTPIVRARFTTNAALQTIKAHQRQGRKLIVERVR